MINIKKIIEEKSKELEIDKHNFVADNEIYEDDEDYLISFYEDIEWPMDGIYYLINKETGKITNIDLKTIPLSKLNKMKLMK